MLRHLTLLQRQTLYINPLLVRQTAQLIRKANYLNSFILTSLLFAVQLLSTKINTWHSLKKLCKCPLLSTNEPAHHTYWLAQCKHTISPFFSKRILQVTLTSYLAVHAHARTHTHTHKTQLHHQLDLLHLHII